MTFNPVLQLVNSVNPAEVQKLARMGIHASHNCPVRRTATPTKEDVANLVDRMIERVNELSGSLYNRCNLAHIITDDLDDINYGGVDYITRRIESGEASGAELKDLRTLKAIAEVMADCEAAKDAIRSEDWAKLNRLMSKYSPATKESRRSKNRAKEIREARARRMAE